MRVDAISLWSVDGDDARLEGGLISDRSGRTRIDVSKSHAETRDLPSDVTGWFVYVSKHATVKPDGRPPEEALVPVYEGNVVDHDPEGRTGRTYLTCEPAGFIDPR